MKIIVRTKLKQTIFLDLDVDYGVGNGSTDRSDDAFGHGGLQGNNYEVLFWPQSVSLEGRRRFLRGAGYAR